MAYEQKTVYNALPKLPTYSFPELNEPASFGRKQFCTMDKSGNRTVLAAEESNKNSTTLAALCNQSTSQSSNPMSITTKCTNKDGCGIPVRVILDHFPTWKTLDDKVLRFFAYFIEEVQESSLETWRVRKVVVYYYLCDGTVSISELTPLPNTGLRHGLIVSRCKVDNISVFTLRIGSTMICRGHTYTLVDCDAATREFYGVMGCEQGEAVQYPVDTFEKIMTRPRRPWNEEDAELRRVAEMQAAMTSHTHSSMLTPAERAHAMSYYAEDKNVLRFYAVWAKQHFRIFYYIADNTIAVMFDPVENDGRERHAVFVRRSRVPRLPYFHCNVHLETLRTPHQRESYTNSQNKSITTTNNNNNNNNRSKNNYITTEKVCHEHSNMSNSVVSNVGDSSSCRNANVMNDKQTSGKNEREYIGVDDFVLGGVVHIYDRPFYLYDCDEYTKSYLAAHGKPINSFPTPPTEREEIAQRRAKSERHLKQNKMRNDDNNNSNNNNNNNNNNEEDSEKVTNKQTCTSTLSSAEKTVRFANDAFRFLACLEKPTNSSAAARRFIVCFYLSDNTIAITEVEQVNSGFKSGKTFSRRQVPELLSEAAFRVGNVVTLDGVVYKLLEMDEHTRQYINDGLPNVSSTHFATADLINFAQEVLRKRFSRANEAFEYFAILHSPSSSSSSSLITSAEPTSELLKEQTNEEMRAEKSKPEMWEESAMLSTIQGLTREQVHMLFRECGKRLSAEELDDVMAFVDSDHDGVIAIDDFSVHFMGNLFASENRAKYEWPSVFSNYSSGTSANATSKETNQTAMMSMYGGPIKSTETITKHVTATEDAKKALHKLLLIAIARRGLIIRSLQTKAMSTYDNRIGIDDFKSVLEQRLQLEFDANELDALVYRFYYSSGVVHWRQRRLEVSEFKRVIMM